MTAPLNNRLSSICFFVTIAAVICEACLAFPISHLVELWQEDRAPMSALQLTLIRWSQFAHDGWLAVITISLFATSLVWRVVAAKRLRNFTSRGFDVVHQIHSDDA